MRKGKGVALAALVAALFVIAVVIFFSNQGMTPGGVAQPTNNPDGPDLLD